MRLALAACAALGVVSCGGAQGAGTQAAAGEPYTEAQRSADGARVIESYERAVREGSAAYLELFDFDEVGAYERLLQRYDLYRGDWLGEPESERRAAPPTPYTAARERRNVGYLFPQLGPQIVGTGQCSSVDPRSAYARRLASFEALPPADEAAWGPLRARVLRTLQCGGMVTMRCQGGHAAAAIVYARLPCTPSGPAPGAALRIVTVYIDSGYP